jgi:ribosomal protein S18 acetylase RimI-like enzyme
LNLSTPALYPEAVACLTAAFQEDPVLSYLFEDEEQRPLMLAAFFANRLASRNETDRLLVPSGSDARNAAALWEAPEKDSENDSSFNAVVAAGISLLGQGWISDRLANLRVLGEAKPKDRHWYLSFVGTRPESRGKGLASTLIESVTNICDQEKIPAYLESSNPDNVSLYESHGFRVIGEAVIKDGPKVPLMWRDPLFE